MPDLEQIQSQIRNLDAASKLLGTREIRELPSILWEDEQVEKLVQGFYNKGQGILVATNKRLVFVDKGLLFGLRVEDFPYDKISSIQYETGVIFGKITIFASGNRADIGNIDKSQVRNFCEYVRAKMTVVKDNPGTFQAAVQTPLDIATELEKLSRLRDQGILTDDEFNAQKKKLLQS